MMLPDYYTSIRVRSVRDNVAVVEEHLRLGRHYLVMMTKHVTDYMKTHEMVVIGGDAKGSRIVERFLEVPDGTQLVVEADIKLGTKSKIAGMLARDNLTSEFGKMIDDLASVAES